MNAAYNNFSEIEPLIDSIHHLCGPSQARWLFDLVRSTREGAMICEVGTFYGYITAALGMACIGTSKRVMSVDHMVGGQCDFPEGSKCIYLDVLDNLERMGVLNKVALFPMKSVYALPIFQLLDLSFDLVYLDGDHNERPVLLELLAFDTMIPVGGMLCGDDCLPAGDPKSFNEMWNSGDPREFYHMGVSQSVMKFFRGNERYEPLEDVPGNQFGFVKVK